MEDKSSQLSTMQRQQRMLKALVAYHGIVTKAAKAAGITPQTHYNWYREDGDYQNQIDLIKYQCHEEFKDLVMDAVMNKIKEGNATVVALCYKSLFKDVIQRLEMLTPYRDRLKAVIKYVDKPQQAQRTDSPPRPGLVM